MLPLQSLEGGEPILDLLQLGGRCVDSFSISSKELGKILELGLDSVPLVKIAGKLRVNRRKLPDAPPNATQGPKHCFIALIKSGVRLFTEPVNTISIGKDLLR